MTAIRTGSCNVLQAGESVGGLSDGVDGKRANEDFTIMCAGYRKISILGR